MNIIQLPVTVCTDVPFEIGESPLWDEQQALLWFVDINGHAIYSFDPVSRQLKHYPMPALVGCIALTDDGRLLAALKTGVHLFDPVSGELEYLVHPETDRPNNRPNDGKVGPDGCFWLGSMDEHSTNISGALYRITRAGKSTRVKDGIFIANGLAWSPDGKTMYHADGLSPAVKAYDFDIQTGAFSNERDFFSLEHEEFGWPDGATVDAAGNYWSAGIFKGRINQISPEGELLNSFQMPLLGTTMPCIGGPTGSTMYVTSLATDLNDERQEGTLLSCDVDAKGVASYRFGIGAL